MRDPFGPAEEQHGDPDNEILNQVQRYGHFSGYTEKGDQWTLSIYHEGDEAKGRELIEIKGVKVWHELRLAADLPPLPTFPSFPQDGEDFFYKWNPDEDEDK